MKKQVIEISVEDGLHLSRRGKEQLAVNLSKTITIELRTRIEGLMRINIPREISWYLMSKTYDICYYKVELISKEAIACFLISENTNSRFLTNGP